MSIGRARAVFDYVAESDAEISFYEGDEIELIEDDSETGDGWFIGLVNGAQGAFPKTYCEVEEMYDFGAAPPEDDGIGDIDLGALTSALSDALGGGFDDDNGGYNNNNGDWDDTPAAPPPPAKKAGAPMPPPPAAKSAPGKWQPSAPAFGKPAAKAMAGPPPPPSKPQPVAKPAAKPMAKPAPAPFAKPAPVVKAAPPPPPPAKPAAKFTPAPAPAAKFTPAPAPAAKFTPAPPAPPPAKPAAKFTPAPAAKFTPAPPPPAASRGFTPAAPPPARGGGGGGGKRYKCIFEFEGGEEDELPLYVGDIVTVTDDDPNAEWWEGECNGTTGVFPSNFVELDAPARGGFTPAAGGNKRSSATSGLGNGGGMGGMGGMGGSRAASAPPPRALSPEPGAAGAPPWNPGGNERSGGGNAAPVTARRVIEAPKSVGSSGGGSGSRGLGQKPASVGNDYSSGSPGGGYAGWLQRKGGLMNAFQRKYMILQGTQLYSGDSEEKAQKAAMSGKGGEDIGRCTVQAAEVTPNGFVCNVAGKPIYLIADNDYERGRWMDALVGKG